MVRTASLFSQLLELFPRLEFAQLVQGHRGERYAKGFTCWQQFVAMLFAHLAGAHSLLDHADYLPAYVLVTLATTADLAVARLLALAAGSIVVFDKGYRDYALWGRWCREGVCFVSRLTRGTNYRVLERRPLPQHRNILADERIALTSTRARTQGCTQVLRRVVVWLPEKEETLELITNHLTFGATTIAAIYKERWQIELFFKALKQHLRLKTFLGTSRNALLIQLWTALIGLLLLKWLQFQSRFGWSLSNLAALLRWNLMIYRNLQEWLNDPFQLPPTRPPAAQYGLFAFGQQLN